MKDTVLKLGAGLRILIILAEEQPRTAKELERVTCMCEGTIRTWTNRLAKAGIIKLTSDGWVISDSKFLIPETKEALTRAYTRIVVNEALKELRAENYENITLLNVSRKTHLPPRVIEDDAHLLAHDHDLTIAVESSLRLGLFVDETSLRRPKRPPSTENP